MKASDGSMVHTTLYAGTTMHIIIRRLLITLLCCLPTLASAATSQPIHIDWRYTPPSTPAVTGFKLYQEGILACQTQDPNATGIDCTVVLTADTTNFSLAAIFIDGTESPQSSPFAFTAPSATTTELKAGFTTNTLGGSAPLPVQFDASSSTGTIASYQWDFGDGSTASSNTASHIYNIAGVYTAKLTVTSTAGLTNIASTSITATASIVITPPAPPTAVISSSTSAGPAPLTVAFNGSGSSAATNASIASYAWSFGDGSSATGANTSHSFTIAGTYSATLTVTDSNGQTNSTETPVVITAPVVLVNKSPTAAITATPISGMTPLTVTFNGSASTDSDGTIASYVWNFGDGSTATGTTVTHTYTTAAAFNATLKVTDNQGATGTKAITITAQTLQQAVGLNLELGQISVNSTWVRVPFTSAFVDPIVIAGPPSVKDAAPCVVCLRNVDTKGFDIRLKEWNYLDGNHATETLNYLVMEKGQATLPDGSKVEAGRFTGTTTFRTVPFSKPFAKIPVVLTTIASENGTNTISGRIKNIGLANFAYYFREQERNTTRHSNETVNFIAWQPGKGTIGPLLFEAAITPKRVTNAWYSAGLKTPFKRPPLLLADMQTTNNIDTSALRTQQMANTGFQVKVQEEQSKDVEVTHPAETVGYLSIDQAQ